ncbi:MAG: hypothetical protein HYU68_14505 [Bacteroidetes bacterium]|nr:hypothetical protein [Bacteroidota bacterium]
MKKLIYIVTFSLLLLSSCEAQSEKGIPSGKSKNKIETLEQEPRFNIRVNKKYDEFGNQIGFDSTYTLYYSNIEGDTTLMDSLFNQFNPFFKNYYSDVFNKQFDKLFFNDSLFYDDFFHTDFFRKRFEINDEYFKKIMEDMDSVKNEFYQKYGEIWSPKKK